MSTRKLISIYADGSSTGKSDGPTGWGWLVIDWTSDEIVCAGSEGAPTGSNNTAELQAAIHGLRAVIDRKLHVGNEVTLVSDSMYALNLANGTYKPNKYHETIKALQALMSLADVKTQWVRGHSGDAFNDRVDELAKAGRDRYTLDRPEGKKKRRSRKREIRRAKRRLVKEWKRAHGH